MFAVLRLRTQVQPPRGRGLGPLLAAAASDRPESQCAEAVACLAGRSASTAGTLCDMSELVGIVRFKFHAGKVEEFKRLSARAMEIVRARDTGTLQYDTYFNADESE